jgi:hypothetical protein
MLILGHTKCPICGEVILKRSDVAQLPYADPKDLQNFISEQDKILEFAARPHVHRKCWESWEHKNDFCQAAFALSSKSFDLDPTFLTLYSSKNRIVFYENASLKIFTLEDFCNLYSISDRKENFSKLKQYLLNPDELSDFKMNDTIIRKNSKNLDKFMFSDDDSLLVEMSMGYQNILLDNLILTTGQK